MMTLQTAQQQQSQTVQPPPRMSQVENNQWGNEEMTEREFNLLTQFDGMGSLVSEHEPLQTVRT